MLMIDVIKSVLLDFMISFARCDEKIFYLHIKIDLNTVLYLLMQFWRV